MSGRDQNFAHVEYLRSDTTEDQQEEKDWQRLFLGNTYTVSRIKYGNGS